MQQEPNNPPVHGYFLPVAQAQVDGDPMMHTAMPKTLLHLPQAGGGAAGSELKINQKSREKLKVKFTGCCWRSSCRGSRGSSCSCRCGRFKMRFSEKLSTKSKKKFKN